MKRIAIIVLLASALLGACTGSPGDTPRRGDTDAPDAASGGMAVVSAESLTALILDGDLIFQESTSEQSRAIRLATGSRYTHVGIVHLRDGRPLVLEAVGPVRLTPLADWIAHGVSGHAVVKRLRDRDAVLTPAALSSMEKLTGEWAERGYDWEFEWDDDELYCSELVWKLFAEGAGETLAPLSKLRDFDLTHPEVAAKLRERYGGNVPLDTDVISPGALFASKRLVDVARTPE